MQWENLSSQSWGIIIYGAFENKLKKFLANERGAQAEKMPHSNETSTNLSRPGLSLSVLGWYIQIYKAMWIRSFVMLIVEKNFILNRKKTVEYLILKIAKFESFLK